MATQDPAKLLTPELMDQATQMAQQSLQNISPPSEVQSVDQSVAPDASVAPISPEKQRALDAANQAMQDAGDDPDKKAAAQILLDDANAMTGGRRRSRRRSAKKSAKKSKKGGARKSKKGGRSRKNGSKRRAHRKH